MGLFTEGNYVHVALQADILMRLYSMNSFYQMFVKLLRKTAVSVDHLSGMKHLTGIFQGTNGQQINILERLIKPKKTHILHLVSIDTSTTKYNKNLNRYLVTFLFCCCLLLTSVSENKMERLVSCFQ